MCCTQRLAHLTCVERFLAALSHTSSLTQRLAAILAHSPSSIFCLPRARSQLFPGVSRQLLPALHKAHVPFSVVPEKSPPSLLNIALMSLVILCFNLALLIFLADVSGLLVPLMTILGFTGVPGGKKDGGGKDDGPLAFIFRRSADDSDAEEPAVTFADVAGCDGAKHELQEIVDFLKAPEKYEALGAKIPKGALMEGPPGTGKTLLARAVAGEAGVPFISASGSEFVEMYVGVGAMRVRKLFKKARKQAPCILFIDEIDAVGGKRASGKQGGGSDERDQTLNQILTEMDGFDRHEAKGSSSSSSKQAGKKQGGADAAAEGHVKAKVVHGVIVLAATNRGDMLDPALLRPGRFDRRVSVELADARGRLEILKVHCREKPLAPDVDLSRVARRTIGFSGASLANLMNEAAIGAARESRDSIIYTDIDTALDRILLGQRRGGGVKRSHATADAAAAARRGGAGGTLCFPSADRIVALHEAGHALVGLLLPRAQSPSKVSIATRSGSPAGTTVFLPTEEQQDSGLYTFSELAAQLAVSLGGRAAEALAYGEEEVTTASADDLQQVRSLARRMVAQWGFASQHEDSPLGGAPVAWETADGNGIMASRCASTTTELAIDAEVLRIVDAAYASAVGVLEAHRTLLDETAAALLERETLDASELSALAKAVADGTVGGTAVGGALAGGEEHGKAPGEHAPPSPNSSEETTTATATDPSGKWKVRVTKDKSADEAAERVPVRVRPTGGKKQGGTAGQKGPRFSPFQPPPEVADADA